MGGLKDLCVPAHKGGLLTFPHSNLRPAPIQSDLQSKIQAFLSTFCSSSHLQPGASWRVLFGWTIWRLYKSGPAPSSGFNSRTSSVPVALTRSIRGPWVKPHVSKKNVKPSVLVILLSDINTHFKRISRLMPLEQFFAFHTEQKTINPTDLVFILTVTPPIGKKKRGGGASKRGGEEGSSSNLQRLQNS